MNKEYIDCEFGLTPTCPEWENPIWSRLMPKEIKPGEGVPTINHVDIENANAFCKNCNLFAPLKKP